jgi:hypothetical protein
MEVFLVACPPGSSSLVWIFEVLKLGALVEEG